MSRTLCVGTATRPPHGASGHVVLGVGIAFQVRENQLRSGALALLVELPELVKQRSYATQSVCFIKLRYVRSRCRRQAIYFRTLSMAT
jgi:hypothetical protein